MTTEPVASLSNVSQRYGKTVALDSISVSFPAATMIGLIGPDGVGKSSLLSLIAGSRRVQRNLCLGNGDVRNAHQSSGSDHR